MTDQNYLWILKIGNNQIELWKIHQDKLGRKWGSMIFSQMSQPLPAQWNVNMIPYVITCDTNVLHWRKKSHQISEYIFIFQYLKKPLQTICLPKQWD